MQQLARSLALIWIVVCATEAAAQAPVWIADPQILSRKANVEKSPDAGGALDIVCVSGCAGSGSPAQEHTTAASPSSTRLTDGASFYKAAVAGDAMGRSWTLGSGTDSVAAPNLELAQASTTSGQKGPLAMCAVTTAAPSYTTAQTDPLSCNVAGGLRVDGSGVTQPVSGTVTARVVGNAGGIFDSANNTAPPANVLVGALETLSQGTQPTAATSTNVRRQLGSTEGVAYVQEGNSNRFSCLVQAVTVTTQCQAAPGAGLRAYVTSAHCSNQAATVQTLDVVFGTGTNCATTTVALTHKVQFGTNATTTSPQSWDGSFDTPLIPTAANAICVRPSAATAFGCTLTGYIAP